MSTSAQMPVSGGASEPLPRPESERRFSEEAVRQMEEIASHYPERRAAMLPALWIAQREYGGFLPPAALMEVAERLGRPYAEVEAVASFYTMYNFRPRGRHHLEVCTCLTCSVVGACEVVHKLEELLGVEAGQTTPDGEFTLSEVECLDWCGAATVIQVGDHCYGNVTPENVGRIVEELRRSDDFTPARLADSIVKLHLPGGRRIDMKARTEAPATAPGDERPVPEPPPTQPSQ